MVYLPLSDRAVVRPSPLKLELFWFSGAANDAPSKALDENRSSLDMRAAIGSAQKKKTLKTISTKSSIAKTFSLIKSLNDGWGPNDGLLQ